ncbi:MAG: hypothetical protein R3Y24_14180 [Eubacteriales bacterium]
METNGIINQELIEIVLPSSNIEDKLDKIIQLIEEIEKYNAKIYTEQSLWEVEEFVEWIYSGKGDSLTDLKRELSIKINKSISVDHTHNIPEQTKFTIAKNSVGNKFYLIPDYYRFKQSILAGEIKNDFVNDLSECFSRIYFDETVRTSVNSLNNRFEDIRGEIVHHLAAIDQYNQFFLELSANGKSNQELSSSFREFSHVDCSPQAGREHVGALYRTYMKLNGEEKELCCELHTKFDTYNRNREKQDRIYFHPGDEEVKEGKSIVVHIGTHL